MPLIVETGEVVESADCYADLVYADQYHADRGNSTWAAATDPQKEAAMRNAAQFMDGAYLSRWKGQVLYVYQARQWPRYGVQLSGLRSFAAENYDLGVSLGMIPSNMIPVQIKQANCELALRALSGSLSPDMPRGDWIKKQTIGPITQEFEKQSGGTSTYPVVEQLLAPFVTSSNSAELVRC